MGSAWSLGALLLCLLAFGGCGEKLSVGDAPQREVINTREGSYRGIALDRDYRGDIVRRLGKPGAQARYGFAVPLASEETHGAGAADCEADLILVGDELREAGLIMRYQLVSFMLGRNGVCDWMTIEDGAATERGVAIGDSLTDAEQAYPQLECGIRTFSEGPSYPYCNGKLRVERHIWFGGDPIDTIEMNTRPME